jgi:hypothetical protein
MTTAKPTYWVTLQRWMNLTIEEHRRLDAYCHQMGLELGFDLIGDRASERRRQADFQKDHDESQETAGGPGR